MQEIIEGLLVVFGIVGTLYGLDAWRREHLGMRRIELAEDTLALFYEASEAIRYLRSPIGFSNETADVEKKSDENDEQYTARKNASVVFYRYQQKQELFSKLHAMRYRFMAQIGKQEAKPFEDINAITKEIIIAARMLAKLWARSHIRTERQLQEHNQRTDKFEAVFWEGAADEDPINPKIDKVISDIEKTCKKVIDGHGTLYGLLNWKFQRGRQ